MLCITNYSYSMWVTVQNEKVPQCILGDRPVLSAGHNEDSVYGGLLWEKSKAWRVWSQL